MFTKKNKTPKSTTPANNETNSPLKSWLTGKLGSFILLSAAGYALYKWQIISKLTSYFKKDKGKATATN